MSSISGKGLVDFVLSKIGIWNYVYGMKGEILTSEKLNSLYNTYGQTGFPSNYYELSKNFIGTYCTDCSGLIGAYTGKFLSSSGLSSNAIKKESVSTLDNAPIGAILWQSGHVGVYIGKENGVYMCVEAQGTPYGVVKSKVSTSGFTHWLIMDYIDYDDNKEEVEFIQRGYSYGGETKFFDVINIDDNYYVKVRDLTDLLNKEVEFIADTKTTVIK